MPRKKANPTQDRSLTPDERETVILMDDGTDVAKISTHQRTIYTKLKNNPAAELTEDISFGKTVGGCFEMPAALISFRTRRMTRTLTDKQQAEQKERAKAAVKAKNSKAKAKRKK